MVLIQSLLTYLLIIQKLVIFLRWSKIHRSVRLKAKNPEVLIQV